MSDPLGVVGVVLAGKFRVERLLGEGGFGVVYAGVHTVLGEPIAIKFIKLDGVTTDPARAAEEVLREARILFSLAHPAIVRMYDVGALERGPVRLPWVVLELLSGATLEQEIAQRRRDRRPWSAAGLREIFLPILDGLAFAHGRGIMHRDIKPSNIQLSRAASGTLEPKLLDFGTARSQLSALQTSLGQTGFTPLYGAPEQWDPSLAPPAPATDVYALGLTLLECATLQRPHAGAEGLPAIMRSVMGGGGLPRLAEARPDLPAALAALVARALAVQPHQRFRDASELRDALREALAPASPGASSAPSAPPAFAPAATLAMSAPPFGMTPRSAPPFGATPRSAPPFGATPMGATPMGAMPGPPFRTTTPLVGAPPDRAPSSSRLGVIAIVLAALALLTVLAAAAAGALLYFREPTPRILSAPVAPRAPSPAPAAPAAGIAGKAILAPQVGSSENFDRANAVAVAQKNHPAVEACAARSHRFNGTIDVVLDVSSKDGRVIGADCHTVWPSHDAKHPKLDPEAVELCACLQTATASWRFAPPKGDLPGFDDTTWLHVQYVCMR